jgi:hypothetical protein
MTAISILELILSLVPSGITLTQEIIGLVQALETAFKTVPSDVQTTAVTALASLLKKA